MRLFGPRIDTQSLNEIHDHYRIDGDRQNSNFFCQQSSKSSAQALWCHENQYLLYENQEKSTCSTPLSRDEYKKKIICNINQIKASLHHGTFPAFSVSWPKRVFVRFFYFRIQLTRSNSKSYFKLIKKKPFIQKENYNILYKVIIKLW